MDVLLNFLVKNYLYFIFGGILLVLALIGYIIDSGKERKVRKEKAAREKETENIPFTPLNANVRLGTSQMNGGAQMLDSSQNQNNNYGVPPVNTK